MKNVLITGANRGIGFEIARQLVKKDFHVIMTGRNEIKLSEALNKIKNEPASAEMLLMDVSDSSSISQAAQILSKRKMRIDVLINNAGILFRQDRSLLNEEIALIEKTLNTNAYGPLKVIRGILPLMVKPGKIINISSGGGSMSDPVGGWSPAYCVSKTLLSSITRQLAYELVGQNISVNAVSPGWVKTGMGGFFAKRSVEKGAETIVWLATEAPQQLTGKYFKDKKEILW